MIFELIIPCYNESKSLAAVIARTAAAAKDAGMGPAEFQLIVVDNGSTDATRKILLEQAGGPFSGWFRTVTVEQNKGYGYGIFQGLKASTADYIGWTHADEQCDPKDAFTALARLGQSSSPANTLAKGRRYSRKAGDFLWSRFFELVTWLLLRTFLWEINAQPKVFPRALLAHLTAPPDDFAFDLYALFQARRAGWKFITIPVLFALRTHGVSHWASTFRSRMATSLKIVRYMRRLRGIQTGED